MQLTEPYHRPMIDESIGDTGRPAFDVRELGYPLPESLIAQHPVSRREEARLLIVDSATGRVRDGRVVELPDLLRPGDLLVLNDTKVLPAKFTARRQTGGTIPGLFVREERPGVWRVMLQGSRRLRVGETLAVTPEVGKLALLKLKEDCGEGLWLVGVDADGTTEQILKRIGRTPLPPYIRRAPEAPTAADREDRARYQTVYARTPGAIAAPTAGLHLTDALLEQTATVGVKTAFVTLHVGLGTFKPISVDCLSEHAMHREQFDLPAQTADAVGECRKRGGRVVAVGTTSVRVLESAATGPLEERLVAAQHGSADLFIYPPYAFRVVDGLLTNFHLPRSTLLALVMAFAGVDTIRRAYRHAIDQEYRFYSYGDAMLIL